jgi:uncharacterized protein with PQ loop repeat
MQWLNTTDYTIPELTLFGVGCFLWVIAYGILIRNIIVFKRIEMPTIAGCGNFAWEFVYSWFIITDMGALMLWGYRAWFFLDIFIWGMLLKYGREDTFLPPFRRYFPAYAMVMTVAWGAAYWFMKQMGYETSIGAVSAYLLNTVISVLYVVNFYRVRDRDHYSIWIAWLKFLGTGLISVFMVMHYPDNHFIHLLAAIIAVYDGWYVGVLHAHRRGVKIAYET